MTYERNEEQLRHGQELMRRIQERIAKEQARLPPRREKLGWEFYRACKKADEDFAKQARTYLTGHAMAEIDYVANAERIAIAVLGPPNPKHSTRGELRWGTNGSMAVDLGKGVFKDHETGEGGGMQRLVALKKTGGSYSAANQWIKDELRLTRKLNGKASDHKRQHIDTYDYVDESGELLFQVLRYDSEPRFSQRRPNGNGWEWKLGDARRVLYRLPQLIEGLASEHPVVVVEGEKDVKTAVRLGLVATCNSGGAGKWRDEYDQYFAGAEVIIVPDNDPAGAKHQQDVVSHLLPIARRVRVVNVPDAKDLTAWVERGGTREAFDALVDNVPTASAEAKPEPPALPWINMSTWDDGPPPQQEWAVFNRVPIQQCALFSGEGAAGKSTVELHRSAAHVLGRDWLGSMPEPGPAFHIDAEDDEGVLHRRLAKIVEHYGVKFADLVSNGLHLMSFAGKEALLATVNRSGKVEPTTLYKQLFEAAGDIKPKSISISSCANIFTGDENNRSQVQQLVGLLTGMAIVANGSVVLVSHPSLTGITTDSGISGTTQWHNAVRARFYMKSPKAKADEQPDTDLREIVFKKNQYGRVEESIVLRYSQGMFLPLPGVGTLDKVAREAEGDELFLRLVDATNRRNERVSSLIGAHLYAPTVFASDAEAKAARITKDELKAAQERLFKANKIHLEPYGPKSRDTWKIVRGATP